MGNSNDISVLKKGSKSWNAYRKKHCGKKLVMRNFNFYDCHKSDKGDYGTPYLKNLDFSFIDLHMASMRDGIYIDCNFDHSSMKYSDLSFGYFENCTFSNVALNVSKVGSAVFKNCIFDGADMSYITAEDTKFINCSFICISFRNAKFINTDFSESLIVGGDIYGISSWDLNLTNTIMEDLSITKDKGDNLYVDDMELGQFIYLMINNEKLRNVIDAITSKVVLILGRFTEERKLVLLDIKKHLRNLGYVPILFDFDCPSSRNVSETILTISGMAKFIIADITDPRSIPQELQIILPNITSVLIQPIIKQGEKPYGMFLDHISRPSLLPLIEYKESEIKNIISQVVENLSE